MFVWCPIVNLFDHVLMICRNWRQIVGFCAQQIVHKCWAECCGTSRQHHQSKCGRNLENRYSINFNQEWQEQIEEIIEVLHPISDDTNKNIYFKTYTSKNNAPCLRCHGVGGNPVLCPYACLCCHILCHIVCTSVDVCTSNYTPCLKKKYQAPQRK